MLQEDPFTNNIRTIISRHDLVREQPPSCWQDGFVLGNGSLGAVFYVPEALEWLVNKTDVIDARTGEVKKLIPRDEADRMVHQGASANDFERAEHGDPGPEGMGPKTCCRLTMDLGMTAGAGTRSALPAIRSRLDLYDGTLQVELDKHLCHPKVESFVRADEDTLMIRVKNVSPLISYHTRLFFSRPEDIELPDPKLWVEGHRLMMRMEMPDAGFYVAALQAVPKPTLAYRDDILPRIREKYRAPLTGTVNAEVRGRFGMLTIDGDFDLYLTVATDRDADDPEVEVHRRMDAAVEAEYDQVAEDHRAWWHEFWSRSRVEMDDKSLEGLFYQSLYALGCSYRKAPMSGLLGLFYGPSVGPLQITPWTGDLHHDLNVQCPFFPVHALNHSDLFEAYLETYHAFLPEARRLAREVWGVHGAHFDMCFNARGKSIFGGVGKYRYFFGGSYIGLMHCLCWRYRRNRKQLEERIYPFLKEVLAFYQGMMAKGEDGRYHLYPAHACELDVMDTGDPVQVISMLKVCLETAIEAAGTLGLDRDLVTIWLDMLENLPGYPKWVDSKGREVILDGSGIHPDHHVSQAGCLHPVYPCGEVDESSDAALLALYGRTLDSVLDKTAQVSYANDGGWHYQCVWQCFFRAMTALRLGRVHELWELYLPMFLRVYVKPNGLISHDACVIAPSAKSEANLVNIPDESLVDIGEKMPKFEPWCGTYGSTTPNPAAKELAVPLIEASADFLTMITETLLQSHNGVIRVFSGWLGDRGDASFTGLVAEGGISVAARLQNGTVTVVRLTRLPGGVCEIRLKSPWNGKLLDIVLPESEAYVLTPEGHHPKRGSR